MEVVVAKGLAGLVESRQRTAGPVDLNTGMFPEREPAQQLDLSKVSFDFRGWLLSENQKAPSNA